MGSKKNSKGLSRVWDKVLLATTVLSGIIIIGMMLSIGYEVFMRYFLNRPTRWVVHFTEFGLLYVTFLAAAWVLKHEGHVKIDIVLSRLSRKAQQFSETVTSSIGAVVSGAFFWFALRSTVETFTLGKVYYKAITVLQWPILGIMALGSLVLTVEFIIRAYRHGRGKVAAGHEEVSEGEM
ncbi:MAG: TRAP transporter small permease [Chloroflexi bacterium]|nr:TRAP transporter small permease [Chloroflexota bacterium]